GLATKRGGAHPNSRIRIREFRCAPPLFACDLRNDRTASRYRSCAEHLGRCDIVILAEVLEQFRARVPSKLESTIPWGRISAWIVDGDFIPQCIHVGASEPLNQMQLIGRRRSFAVDPGSF